MRKYLSENAALDAADDDDEEFANSEKPRAK
jgi:hypothetical protein